MKKVMEFVVGEFNVVSLGLRIKRLDRIWLNILVLLVVMVVEFIIVLFRDYKHNIVPSPEKFKDLRNNFNNHLPAVLSPFQQISLSFIPSLPLP